MAKKLLDQPNENNISSSTVDVPLKIQATKIKNAEGDLSDLFHQQLPNKNSRNFAG